MYSVLFCCFIIITLLLGYCLNRLLGYYFCYTYIVSALIQISTCACTCICTCTHLQCTCTYILIVQSIVVCFFYCFLLSPNHLIRVVLCCHNRVDCLTKYHFMLLVFNYILNSHYLLIIGMAKVDLS